MPAHLGDTHIAQIHGGRVMVVLADACLFISCFSEISHCVWCSRKAYRMILTLCYPFFTIELGLRIHTSVGNRNLKLPLSTYCMRLRCYHIDLHTLQICKVEVPPLPRTAKPRTQFLMKGEIQNTAHWPRIHQVGHCPGLAHIVGTPDLKHSRENNPRNSMCSL